jgi:hypothetical protein
MRRLACQRWNANSGSWSKLSRTGKPWPAMASVNLLFKQQLLILQRSRRQAPNLRSAVNGAHVADFFMMFSTEIGTINSLWMNFRTQQGLRQTVG